MSSEISNGPSQHTSIDTIENELEKLETDLLHWLEETLPGFGFNVPKEEYGAMVSDLKNRIERYHSSKRGN